MKIVASSWYANCWRRTNKGQKAITKTHLQLFVLSWANKGHNSTNMFDRVLWLAADVFIVIRNKYAKVEANMIDGIEDISICKQEVHDGPRLLTWIMQCDF